MNKVITLTLFVAATVAVSAAINCYNCGGDQGGACADPFKNGPAKTCPPGVTTCIKIKKGHLLLKQGVTRACGAPGSKEGCNSMDSDKSTKVTCVCEGDKCNSAGFAKVSVVALVATLAIPLVFLN